MPEQNHLVRISIAYCMVHMYVLLLLLYEHRGTKKVFWGSATAVFLVTSAACLWIMATQGIAAMGQYGVLIGSVPSLIFLFAFSRQRNAQFVFLFCLCDTVCMWIELASGLIDYAVGGGGVVTLILRLAAFPLLEYAVWRWLRRPFLEMSHIVRRSWILFAILTGVCYLILVILSVYPTIIFQRPQDIPLAVMVLVLIALAYTTIFLVLFEQLHTLKTQERQQVFEAQAVMMGHRVEDMHRTAEAMRIERHDMRHQLQTIASLAQRGDQAALLDYIGTAQDKLNTLGARTYCTNPILNAVLVNAAEQAEKLGIALELSVALPDELPVDAQELSIVFANALENAIRAVEKLPPEQRRILCKSVPQPRFMMEISNPYEGEVVLDREGLPISGRPGHGIGTRSIMAFAEKYNAVCLFRVEHGWFKVQIAV